MLNLITTAYLEEVTQALESDFVGQDSHWVVGARSTALSLARQLCDAQCEVRAVGFEALLCESMDERDSMQRTFRAAGVVLHATDD